MNRHSRKVARMAIAGVFACGYVSGAMAADGDAPGWPEIDATCKPWAYQWWLGSAVDKGNLSRELVRYRDAGLGGIHVGI